MIQSWEGNLQKSDGTVMVGEFMRHKPHGQISINYPNGDQYDGEVNMGIMEGQGKVFLFYLLKVL